MLAGHRHCRWEDPGHSQPTAVVQFIRLKICSTAAIVARRSSPPPRPSSLGGSERCHQHHCPQNFLLWRQRVCQRNQREVEQQEMCQKNKDNRGNVKYHHTTGSRAYMVHVENLDDKYNDEEPNAFDLFKEFHYSKKKKCFTPVVQEAITRMENKLSATTEGEEHKSAAQVVADVLAENTKKNQFLKNVGFQNATRTSEPGTEQGTETELEAERKANAKLRVQVADLSKAQAEMEAKHNLLLSQVHPS